MTLLELLVQELPKRGGWPSEATKLHQDYDGEVWMHLVDDDVKFVFRLDQAVTNARQPAKSLTKENIVTREQYEAALQQSAWDGTGLPPVGCECEFSFSDEPYRKCKILFVSKKTMLVACETSNKDEDNEEAFAPEDVKFRPIRTEAGKKRDEAKHEIAELCRTSASNGHSAELIYDAIAAGKIPGVKLE